MIFSTNSFNFCIAFFITRQLTIIQAEICKKVSSAIGVLKRVRPFISKETAIQIYNALIMPHFDYCSPVWDCLSGYLSDKLQNLQNRVARVITKSPFDASSNHLLSTLSWERLSLRRKKEKALMMYKTMNDLAREYLQSLFSQRHSVYNLRNSEGRLTLSKPSTMQLFETKLLLQRGHVMK